MKNSRQKLVDGIEEILLKNGLSDAAGVTVVFKEKESIIPLDVETIDSEMLRAIKRDIKIELKKRKD